MFGKRVRERAAEGLSARVCNFFAARVYYFYRGSGPPGSLGDSKDLGI